MGKQIVNIPSFMVRVDSQKHVDFALNSPFGGGRPGRNKRRSQASKVRRAGSGWGWGFACGDGGSGVCVAAAGRGGAGRAAMPCS